MNEPHMATWWFPSNDHPLDKARFDIRITTGKEREVISNGRRVGRRVPTAGWPPRTGAAGRR
jgi:aminopeptidase N